MDLRTRVLRRQNVTNKRELSRAKHAFHLSLYREATHDECRAEDWRKSDCGIQSKQRK